jgi:hypothetical protein
MPFNSATRYGCLANRLRATTSSDTEGIVTTIDGNRQSNVTTTLHEFAG